MVASAPGCGARKRVTLILAALAGAVVVGGCSEESGPIKIGVSANFDDVNMDPMRYGARLAVDEINASGGINGRLIEIVERNDREDPDSAVVVATELYNDPAVVAVVGNGFSGLTLAAAPIYNSGPNPLVQISPTASAPAVSQAGPFTFRVCPSDVAHGGALARWARDGLGLVRGNVIYGNDAYGRGVRQAFVSEFTAIGGEVLTADPYLGSPPEVEPYLDRIAQTGRTQFIVLAGYLDEAEHILAETRRRGITVPFMGGDGIERIERLGALAEGTYVTAAYLSLVEHAKKSRVRRRLGAGLPRPGTAQSVRGRCVRRRLPHQRRRWRRSGPTGLKSETPSRERGTIGPAFEGAIGHHRLRRATGM